MPQGPLGITWSIVDEHGHRRTSDVFGIITEAIGEIPRKLYREAGLNALWGKPIGSISRKIIIKLEKDAIKQGTLTPEKLAVGMRRFDTILGKKAELDRIAERAYNFRGPGGVIYEFRHYLKEKDRLEIPPTPKKGRSHFTKARDWKLYLEQRGKREYANAWEKVVRTILGPPKHQAGGGVRSFGQLDLTKFELNSQNSSFKSVFLMEEFGTGMNADQIRPFISVTATPWKVPPQIAALWPISGTGEGLWWTRGWMRTYAYRLFAGLQKDKRSSMTWLKTKAKNVQTVPSIINYQEFKKISFRTLERYKTRAEPWNPIEMAFGGKPGGDSIKGRVAQHIFYDRNGVVAKIREIQQKAFERMLIIIDNEIQKEVETFPSFYRAVFGTSGYLNSYA